MTARSFRGRTGASNWAGPAAPSISPATSRANAFVRSHLDAAGELGRKLADLVGEPDALATALRRGLASLGDPKYLAGQRIVAPGIGELYGVRQPLLEALARSFLNATSGTSTDLLLLVASRLLREDHQEPRWLGMGFLERTIDRDPERTWQLIRVAARQAGDWIAVDTLAHPAARGILNEPYRWAELEQLAFSPSRWERRLIGSTVATMPFVDRERARRPEVAARALQLLSDLIGDADPDVQKALSWAYRNLLLVDRPAVETALAAEAEIAAGSDDGHRAWVIRDTLPKLDPVIAARLRARLEGIRRRAGSPATSRSAATVARFGALPNPAGLPEPPLFDRQTVGQQS